MNDDAGMVRPFRRRVRHPACGTLTVISGPAAEALALDPRSLPAIRCTSCQQQYPAGDFAWIGDDGSNAEPVGWMPPPEPDTDPEAHMADTESPSWCGHGHGCHAHMFTELAEIRRQIGSIAKNQEKLMTEQSQLDATATAIEGDVASINTGIGSVQAEIAALEQAAQQGQPLDFTNVNNALSDLAASTSSVTAAGAEVPPAAPSGDTGDGSATPSA